MYRDVLDFDRQLLDTRLASNQRDLVFKNLTKSDFSLLNGRKIKLIRKLLINLREYFVFI
jgi:hypothetical protein